ncbi:MAG: glycosyltransferase family 2 protein [Treponema sp.]|nr:glycosyltransferase family 2 protein [Treponema sp.]
MITVFTPTYNRAYMLPKLYESLLAQTCRDFEWLIVDDGSTDETINVVKELLIRNEVNIQYHYKENGGLNSAYNYAVTHTDNEIFFRVDSDDSIKKDAIQSIYDNWHFVENDTRLCGLVFLSVFDDNKTVGFHPFEYDFETNFFDYRYKYHATGDRAEVIKTEVLRQYLFPLFKDEKFVPEGLMWNRIANRYNCVYVNKPIYVRNYGGDSITAKIVKILKRNNKGATLYYSELLKHRQPIFFFFKHSLLYWRYAFYKKCNFAEKTKESGLTAFVVGFLPSLVLLALDKMKGRSI